MPFGVTEVDYGEQEPEHFDRFGLRHYAHVYSRHRNSTFVDVNLNGIIKRLGLTLMGWSKRYYNVHHYFLQVHDRPLEIRRYSDGRIKLFLDGACVYAENTKVVLRHGVRYREVAVWTDPAVDDEENRRVAEEERQKRLDAARAMLEERRAGVTSREPTEETSHGNTREEDGPGEEDSSGQEDSSTTA